MKKQKNPASADGKREEAAADLPPWLEELPPLSNCHPKHLLGTLGPGARPARKAEIAERAHERARTHTADI